MLARGINDERQLTTFRRDHALLGQINTQLVAGEGFDFIEQAGNIQLVQDDRQQAVLEAVVKENIGKGRRDNGAKAVLHQGPGSVLTAGTTTKVLARQQHGSALVAVLVQHKIRVQRAAGIIHAGLAMIQIAQFIKQIGAKAGALDGFEELLGDDQVRIHVLPIQGSDQTFMSSKCLHGVDFLS